MDCGSVHVWLLPLLGRQVLAHAGRTDGGGAIDPFAAGLDGCFGGSGVVGREISPGQPQVDDMGARFGNSLTKTLQVGRIGGREMIQQWIYVINSKFLHHHRRELFDVHTRRTDLLAAIGGTLNVVTEGPRRDGQPITWTGWKVQLGSLAL